MENLEKALIFNRKSFVLARYFTCKADGCKPNGHFFVVGMFLKIFIHHNNGSIATVKQNKQI